ncbi:MAG: UvrB/UvrC motif-containing protein [Gemmatimonadetes bacterium]|nr:UvrB/UvrC motif-containing protein [Gemmatimonadota bacterium]
MDMDKDLLKLLDNWEYDPDSNVRKIVGDDGIQKIQVRVDQGAFQGILQLNLDGRPDGKRPHDSDFALDHYRGALESHRSRNSGRDEGFNLGRESCQELFDEGARVYGRYVFLLQLKDYGRVIRDTERNMQLFRFVHRYASHEDDRMNLQKWWPYVLRIHATAKAMLAARNGDYDEAIARVRRAREEIDDLPEVEAEEFFVEKERSQQALDELEEELRENKPLSKEEKLKRALQEAVEREDFERAADIRDRLKGL